MRSPRLKLPGRPAVYHCVSRIVGGAFLLHDLEKEGARVMKGADWGGLMALRALQKDVFG